MKKGDYCVNRQRLVAGFIAVLTLLSSIIVSGKVFIHFSNTIGLPSRCIVFDSTNNRYCHFSVDDSNSIFLDLTNNQNAYESAFEQPILEFVKKLHDQYGIKVSFYVFFSWDVKDNNFDLSKSTDKYSNEFVENSDWLKFGFHAKDASAYENQNADIEQKYFDLTVKELTRIVGKESIDYFIRLDRYTADTDTLKALKNAGVDGLLISPDRNRQSYSLSDEEQKLCYENDWYIDQFHMLYTPTDIQVELINNDDEFYTTVKQMATQPRIEIFTHEWAIDEWNVKKYLTWYAYSVEKNNVKFSFSRY